VVSGGIEVLPGSDPILAKVLYARGLDSPEKLRAFTMAEESVLGNPFQMAGVNGAVARLRRALSQGERIVVPCLSLDCGRWEGMSWPISQIGSARPMA